MNEGHGLLKWLSNEGSSKDHRVMYSVELVKWLKSLSVVNIDAWENG